ncbi:3-hydroxylacyl-ACP dehydratase [Maridesulfovibrio sp.]|uniref:3-hydroxylacyl-ACP dehydratase n=1 Tax=Maridesulfovibrio sp. TaxID=2795000 RepID=UPI002A18A42E|nr:3-hydroxylacyl-ACP dehydratase [Maridesulfovibrio sp.]
MQLPVNAEKLLPHRGTMLLIDKVLTAGDRAGTVSAVLDGKSISRDSDGRIQPVFYIELVAQAYAAVCGYEFISKGLAVPEGFLVGVQNFEIYKADSPGTDSELLISVSTIGEIYGFAVVEGSVSQDGKPLAGGQIKLFVPQD